jgi:putative transposase
MTHVTYDRTQLLIENIGLWHDSVNFVKTLKQFELIAWVILPDHLHLMVDFGTGDLSYLMKRIKMKFSGLYRSKWKLKSGRAWQFRFWDHMIRDEDDFRNHIDYIHYNPIKHGLVIRPGDWEHSSFKEYYRRGFYGEDWGIKEPSGFDGSYGE